MVYNYKYKNNVDQIMSENPEQKYWKTIEIHKRNGYVEQVLEDAEFPRKGYCSPEGMFACNQVKRIFVSAFKLYPIFILSNKKLINIFNDICYKILSPHIVVYNEITPMAQEVRDILKSFLIKINIEEQDAKIFAELISTIIDYDDAYRFRVQDLMVETTKTELIKRPITEIKWIIKKAMERDFPDVAIKFKRIGTLLTLLLLIPKYRKAFRETIEESHFDKMYPDKADWYWMCQREDYKFGGYTNEQRKNIIKVNGWSLPKVVYLDKNKKIC